MNIKAMLDGYIACALWSTVDDNDEQLDAEYHQFAPATLKAMRKDCEAYARDNAADLAGMDPGQAGHDFWLTRNGHGAGYWDRGLGELGDRLTDACRPYGEYSIYIGDDGRIHGQ